MVHRKWAKVSEQERNDLRTLMLDPSNKLTAISAANLINVSPAYFRYYITRDLGLSWVKDGKRSNDGHWRLATQEERDAVVQKIKDNWYGERNKTGKVGRPRKQSAVEVRSGKNTRVTSTSDKSAEAIASVPMEKREELPADSDILEMLKQATATMRQLREQNEALQSENAQLRSDFERLASSYDTLQIDASVWRRSHEDLMEDRQRERKQETILSLQMFKEEFERGKKLVGQE